MGFWPSSMPDGQSQPVSLTGCLTAGDIAANRAALRARAGARARRATPADFCGPARRDMRQPHVRHPQSLFRPKTRVFDISLGPGDADIGSVASENPGVARIPDGGTQRRETPSSAVSGEAGRQNGALVEKWIRDWKPGLRTDSSGADYNP